ncbi:MAG: glycosyltransferase [Lunatimonas sp.]|uniref:glycosyltransferase n=1 Tax=Lunatimonas sp. TaxID=2060141 RepID=UPI00263A7016|nr:glycosyltransferase [Lunatimonas sp.]MCC5938211.1 glycosyltransferase [Lunatimonas sp.]
MGKDLVIQRTLNFVSFVTLVVFILGFVLEVGIGNKVLYILLTISLIFKVIEVVFEWYHFSALTPRKNLDPPPRPQRQYSVDMLTTACPGEPFDMIARSLKAMVAVRYPHTSYLCDEGDDPKLKALCEELGVIHVTRETHEHAKAGNINNALKQATGELCVILDPDHAPYPEFLDYVVHHFDDPEIGYVQVVQAYKNQPESLVAQAAAEQTYMYYGPYMEAMSKFGTAQAIGANCTFRREALDSIGGHAPGLTEDMHTSMLLHAKGWKSLYVPKILSLGLVPSSLAAYYQQQLKWSRGTFDLWVNLLPKLFSKFTWRQKIHYLLLPVYFLFGVIGIIDVVVPVYSLVTGEYPWLLNPTTFFAFFTPFLLMSFVQRFYAQKWLHKRDEKGIHILGGVLRTSTWWVYTLGFVYTLFNVKVPYIPTPKEHSTKGDFALGLPNLFFSLLSFGAVYYGLKVDWQPYSMLMAFFASINGVIFFLAFILGQSVMVKRVRKAWYKFKTMVYIEKAELTYVKVSRYAIPIAIIVPLVFSVYFILDASNFKLENLRAERGSAPLDKELGGFYLGIYLPEFVEANDRKLIVDTEEQVNRKWSIISTYLYWSDGALPVEHWEAILEHGAIPMITWEPWSSYFEGLSDVEDLANEKKVFKYIVEGYFDEYIEATAIAIRDLDAPVFLRFAHEVDNPMYPWSATGGNTAEEFMEAWKYIHYKFEFAGAQNVSWVFTPWSPDAIESYFPYGSDSSISEFVDWIGLTALNYGAAAADGQAVDFDQIYLPYQEKIQALSLELPVMLAEFGSTSYDTDGVEWVNNSLAVVKQKYPEIRSAVLFYSDVDRNWITDWRPSEHSEFIDWTYELSSVSNSFKPFRTVDLPVLTSPDFHSVPTKSTSIIGEPADFTFLVDGQPFYMKGVCYNTGHDWEEGFIPLSRKQVEGDFKKMKTMGANIIRRYEPSIYDRNIFREANEQGLKIMYGFWFDPKVDYANDLKRLASYERKVLQYVEKHKNERSIAAWNIGNETWGLLKKKYGQPYLTVVRKGYVDFLENLAQKIHAIDPVRPIFSSEEHDNVRLLGSIFDFRQRAPSLDALGVNSYYESNISVLHDIFAEMDPDRPYAVTEFGPKGYWNRELGDFWRDSILIELSSVSKGQLYKRQWTNYIEPNKGSNLGGFAFSWQDRFEGTATWFGITDFKGNPKPAYHYLASAWGGVPLDEDSFPDLSIVGHWQGAKPKEKIWLTAAITNGYEGSLNYHWEVYEEETWKRSSPVVNSLGEDQKYVEIKVPKRPSRIYVHASDSLGNVITASRPLIILD